MDAKSLIQKIKETEEIQKPIGDFIFDNAEGQMGVDGAYYHYSDVCTLIKLYHKKEMEKLGLKSCSSCGKDVEPKFGKLCDKCEDDFQNSNFR